MIIYFLAQLVGTLLLPFLFFIIAKKNPGIIREIFYFLSFSLTIISFPMFIFDNDYYVVSYYIDNVDIVSTISFLLTFAYIPIRIIFNKNQKKKASREEPSI